MKKYLNFQKIIPKNTIKYLEVLIQDDLLWNTHLLNLLNFTKKRWIVVTYKVLRTKMLITQSSIHT